MKAVFLIILKLLDKDFILEQDLMVYNVDNYFSVIKTIV